MLNQSVTFLGQSGFGFLSGLGADGGGSCAFTPQSNIPTCNCSPGYKMAQKTEGASTQYWCQKTKTNADGSWSFDWSDAVGGVKDLLGLTCSMFGFGCPKAAELPNLPPGGGEGYNPEPWYQTTGGMVAMGLGALGVGALVYMSVKRK